MLPQREKKSTIQRSLLLLQSSSRIVGLHSLSLSVFAVVEFREYITGWAAQLHGRPTARNRRWPTIGTHRVTALDATVHQLRYAFSQKATCSRNRSPPFLFSLPRSPSPFALTAQFGPARLTVDGVFLFSLFDDSSIEGGGNKKRRRKRSHSHHRTQHQTVFNNPSLLDDHLTSSPSISYLLLPSPPIFTTKLLSLFLPLSLYYRSFLYRSLASYRCISLLLSLVASTTTTTTPTPSSHHLLITCCSTSCPSVSCALSLSSSTGLIKHLPCH